MFLEMVKSLGQRFGLVAKSKSLSELTGNERLELMKRRVAESDNPNRDVVPLVENFSEKAISGGARGYICGYYYRQPLPEGATLTVNDLGGFMLVPK